MQEGWRIVLDPTRPEFQYDTLGRIIRNNIVRGNPMKYDRGVTQTDFNGSVFDQRQQHTESTSEHHKRRDDLSTTTLYNDLTPSLGYQARGNYFLTGGQNREGHISTSPQICYK